MDAISEIKEKLNIIDIISPYVMLRKRGSNWFGLCPFHNEKTGSFSVNEDRGYFHCFGCGESGDIFSFIQKKEHVDFKEALEILAKQANIDISKNVYDAKDKNEKSKLVEINEVAQKFFSWILKEHKIGVRGRNYVKKRKILKDAQDVFLLGYAPTGNDNLYKILKKRDYTDQDILDSGVCVKRENSNYITDKFRGRLMFPTQNTSDHVVGFSGRYIPVENPKFEPPKYLNTGETRIFNKGKLLYGFSQAKDEILAKGFVIISEGQINIISSFQVGIKNIVASMGTALTPDQLKLLSRYTKNLYLCFDSDNAGQVALVRGIKLALQQDFNIRVVVLQKGSDPDEEISNDVELWKLDIANAIDAIDFLIETAKKDYKTIDDTNNVLEKFIEIYNACVNPVTKEILVQKLSNEFGISDDSLNEYFSTKKAKEIIPILKVQNIPSPSVLLSSHDAEEYTLALICQNYDVLKKGLNTDYVVFFEKNEDLYLALCEKNIDDILGTNVYDDLISTLLTKNLPDMKDLPNAFNECINTLRNIFVKKSIDELKKELLQSTDSEQEQILQQINELVQSRR